MRTNRTALNPQLLSPGKKLPENEPAEEPNLHHRQRSISHNSLRFSASVSERSRTNFKRKSRAKTVKRSASAEPELSARTKLVVHFTQNFADGLQCPSCGSRSERGSKTCRREKAIRSIFNAAYAKLDDSSSDLSDKRLMSLSKKVRKVMEDKKLMKRCRRSTSLDGAKEMDEQELASLFGNMNMERERL